MSGLSRGKAAKAKLKEETAQLNAKRQLIANAEAEPDLLADLPMFRQFDRNGLSCALVYFTSCPPEYRDWAYTLTAQHMKAYYDGSWGWSDKNKRLELFEEHSRYLIALADTMPIGFIHIRFEMERSTAVLYVYELQIEDACQGKGLGRFLMQAAEFIALKRKMEAVMLTVFKANIGACQFYSKLRYQRHETSPDNEVPEDAIEATYTILFKPLIKKST
jgi:ribosomal protein S18 acetylase RimI-like enzyme